MDKKLDFNENSIYIRHLCAEAKIMKKIKLYCPSRDRIDISPGLVSLLC